MLQSYLGRISGRAINEDRKQDSPVCNHQPQNLKLSLFSYYSPSDKDGYLRPKVHYKVSDTLAVETDGNLFFGQDDHTFFAQFNDNTNVYTGVRYSF